MCYCWSIWVKGRPEIASLSAFLAFIFCLRRLISTLKSNAIFSCVCCGIFYHGDMIFEDFFHHRLGGEDVKVCLLFMRISFVFTFSIWFFRPTFHHWFNHHRSQVSLELSFMKAVQGSTKTVTFQTHLPCEPCGMVVLIH